MISEELRRALKLSPVPMYRIAHRAKLHPSTLSKILRGIEQVKPGDPRVIKLGKVLGIPEDQLFERNETSKR